MAAVQEFGQKIKDLAKAAFLEISNVTNNDMIDVAHILMDNTLQKRPLEYDNLVVRHISISKDEISKITHHNEKDIKKYNENWLEVQPKIIDKIAGELQIEVMPKINVYEKNFTYFDAIRLLSKTLNSLGKYSYDEPYLSLIEESDVVFYKDRLKLTRPFSVKGNDNKSLYADAVIAERAKGKVNFDFPKFNDYVGPSIIFQPYLGESEANPAFTELEYGIKVTNKLCDEFKSLS